MWRIKMSEMGMTKYRFEANKMSDLGMMTCLCLWWEVRTGFQLASVANLKASFPMQMAL
jgi:hypothetical protein